MGMGRAAEGSEDVGRAMIRGAADRGEYRQPAGAASEKCPRPPRPFPSRDTRNQLSVSKNKISSGALVENAN
jgi:hypothetical protein